MAPFGSKNARTLLNTWQECCWVFYATMSEAHPEQRPYPTKAMRERLDAVLAVEEELRVAVREDLGQAEETSWKSA